jgi:hypothetical protein
VLGWETATREGNGEGEGLIHGPAEKSKQQRAWAMKDTVVSGSTDPSEN